jgi:hypothetical protein
MKGGVPRESSKLKREKKQSPKGDIRNFFSLFFFPSSSAGGNTQVEYRRRRRRKVNGSTQVQKKNE